MNKPQKIDTALLGLEQQTPVTGIFVPTLNTLDTGIDGTLHLRMPDINLPKVNVHIRTTLRQYQLLQLLDLAQTHPPFLVFAETIYPAMKKELRQRKINYLDAAGNLYLQHGQTMLLFDGQKPTVVAPKDRPNKAFTKTGLKAVFHFLLQPDAINHPYRQIAEAADIALGNIKSILDGLNEAGFLLAVTKDRYQLQRKKELLERWITAYGDILRPMLHLGDCQFIVPQQILQWKQLPFDIQLHRWGGEPAGDILTNYLQPQQLLIYTTDKMDIVRKWKLMPYGDGIRFYKKFWKDDHLNKATTIAPVLLIYADLLLTDDPRCLETADKIYDQYLKNDFE